MESSALPADGVPSTTLRNAASGYPTSQANEGDDDPVGVGLGVSNATLPGEVASESADSEGVQTGRDEEKPAALSRELTDISVTSQTPLVASAPMKVLGQGLPLPVPPKMPSIDDLSADFLEVPSELPASVPSAAFVQPRSISSLAAFPRAEAFLGQQVEPLSSPGMGPPLPFSLETARNLLEQRRVEMALRLLSNQSEAMEARLLRLRCLVALRRYAEAKEECQALEAEESPPFEAVLLSAQLPWLLNADGIQDSLSRLQALARGKAEGTGLGKGRPLLQLLRVLSHVSLAAGHGNIAVTEIRRAIEKGKDSKTKQELCCLLGRHHVSWGNANAAQETFSEAVALGLAKDAAAALLNDGFLAIARAEYATARDAFAAAASAATADMASEALMADATDEVLSAENNLAVCRLYTKDLRAAQEGLEALVKRSPVQFLKPAVIQNLMSLYEFSEDAASKRSILREVADAFQLQDLDPKLFEKATG